MKKILTLSVLSLLFFTSCQSNNSGIETSLTNSGDNNDETEPTDSDSPELSSLSGYISVHLEPQEEEVAENWEDLASLVDSANDHDIDLTLFFSAPWAEYTLESADRLTTVREWEEDGHEIGLHHHGISHHVSWDGYTNNPSYTDENNYKGSSYKGTMEDLMDLVSQIPADGTILSASMTDEETDWPKGVIYAAGGGEPPLTEDAVSTATEETYNGQKVKELRKTAYAVDRIKLDLSLGQLEDLAEERSSGQQLGLTLTDQFLANNWEKIEDLFTWIQEKGIEIHTLEDLLSEAE